MGPLPSRVEPTGGRGHEAHTRAFSPRPVPWRDPHWALLPGQQPTITVNSAPGGPEPASVVSPQSEGKQGSGGRLVHRSHRSHAVPCAQPASIPRWAEADPPGAAPSRFCGPTVGPGLGSISSSTNVPPRPSDQGPIWVFVHSAGTARSVLGNEDAHTDPDGTGPASCRGCSSPVLGHGCQKLVLPDPGSGCLCRTRRNNQKLVLCSSVPGQDVCVAHEGITTGWPALPGLSDACTQARGLRKGPVGR